MPTPAAGGTVAAFVLFAQHFQLAAGAWILGGLAIGLSCPMVSTVHYPKDKVKMFVLAPRHAFRMLAMCAVVIAIFHYASIHSPAIVLFPLGMTYVLFGIGDELIKYLKRRGHDLPIPEPTQQGPSREAPPDSPSVSNPPRRSHPPAGASEPGSQARTVSSSTTAPLRAHDAIDAPSESTPSSRCGETTTTRFPRLGADWDAATTPYDRALARRSSREQPPPRPAGRPNPAPSRAR